TQIADQIPASRMDTACAPWRFMTKKSPSRASKTKAVKRVQMSGVPIVMTMSKTSRAGWAMPAVVCGVGLAHRRQRGGDLQRRGAANARSLHSRIDGGAAPGSSLDPTVLL